MTTSPEIEPAVDAVEAELVEQTKAPGAAVVASDSTTGGRTSPGAGAHLQDQAVRGQMVGKGCELGGIASQSISRTP
ncbi:hypothetical protein O1L68_00125 [Streptomyces lydicus]|nr:hypothetical protein [Streptomyces lydicus]